MQRSRRIWKVTICMIPLHYAAFENKRRSASIFKPIYAWLVGQSMPKHLLNIEDSELMPDEQSEMMDVLVRSRGFSLS